MEITPAHIFYLSLILSVVLFAEAGYILFATNASKKSRINRRMMTAEKKLTQKDVLIQLRKERGLDAEGNYVLKMAWLNRMIVQAGFNVGISRVIAVWLIGAFLANVIIAIMMRSVLISAAAFPIITFIAPIIYLRMRRSRKMNLFAKQLPEAIDLITRSLKAGHPVPVAITMVSREMPDPIGSEFGMIADEVTYGSDLVAALVNMYERVGHPDLPLLVSSVSIQSTTGGNLREILEGLSKVIRDRLKMKAKVKAISAEGRYSAMFLTAMPIFLLLALTTLVPGYYRGIWIYSDAWWFAGGLVTWLVLGNLLILKLISFKV